jgi:hypothetical protein
VAFTLRIIALPVVIALTLPLIAASRVPSRAAVPCQPCVDCTDDAAPQVVRVRMYNQSRLDTSVFADILEVTNSIWAPYGLNVESATSADAITVVLSGGTLRGTVDATPIAVGDTLFTKHHATPYIHLWLGGAELLAHNSDSDGRPFTLKPPEERDAILLRMLGVALAHELGHYLLDTAVHSSAGLLRATLTARDMEQPNPAHLRLTRKQQQLMCASVPR